MAKKQPQGMEQRLDAIEALVREADVLGSQAALKAIRPAKLTNPEAARYAFLLQRAGFPKNALKLLSRRIRSEKKARPETKELWLYYAYCMGQANATATAFRVLGDPLLQDLPESRLFRGRIHSQSLNHGEAVEELRAYLSGNPGDEYLAWLGETILCRSLVFLGEGKKALAMLEKIEKKLQEKGYRRLAFGLLQTKLEAYFYLREDAAFEKTLREIEALRMDKFYESDNLRERELRVLMEIRKQPETALPKMLALREQCMENVQADTRREIDFRIAKHLGDAEMLQALWFGSPNRHFREQLGHSPCVPFLLNIPPSSQSAARTAKNPQKIVWPPVKLAPLLQRFFAAMICDQYRKPNVEEIFERVYTEFYFNPFTSPLAIRQLMHRFRKKVQEWKIDLTVLQRDGLYWLGSEAGIEIELKRPGWETLKKTPLELELERAQLAEGDRFTAKEYARAIHSPIRNAQVLLKKMLAAGLITQQKRARGAYYMVVKKFP